MPVRPFDPGSDTASVLALAGAGGGGFAVLSEAQRIALGEGSARGWVAADPDLIGYAGVVAATTDHEWMLEVVATNVDVVPSLVRQAIAESPRFGARLLRWWVYSDAAANLPADLGFSQERFLHRMGRPLPGEPPEFAPGVEVGPFRRGVDEEAWLEVNNAAFAGHPENGGWTAADLAARTSLDWFSAGGFRMVWIDRELAAFCWTKVHDDGNGEIYVIAVSPRYGGRGLGTETAREGMRHLSEVGCGRVFLYVDGGNVAAVNMYRRLGFEVEATHRAFTIDVG